MSTSSDSVLLKKAVFTGQFPWLSSTKEGKLVFHVDNHLLNSFTKCHAYFQLRHLNNWKRKAGGGALSIGIWWSSVLEQFYDEMFQMQRKALLGQTKLFNQLTPAERAGLWQLPGKEIIIKNALDAWVEHKMWELEKRDPYRVGKFAGSMNYSEIQKAVPSALFPLFDKFKELKLPASAIWMACRYYDANAMLDSQNWQIIATEKGFGLKDEVLIGEDDDIVVYYTGRPDLVVYEPNSDLLFPVDHKTVDTIRSDVHRKFKPHPQLVGYIYATQKLCEALGLERTVDRCVANVCARSEPSDKPRSGKSPSPRFIRVYPQFSQQEIEEWRQNVFGKCLELADCVKNDRWTWNETACHVYGGCEYRGVHSLAPGARHIALTADFVQTDPWAPYVAEEDED